MLDATAAVVRQQDPHAEEEQGALHGFFELNLSLMACWDCRTRALEMGNSELGFNAVSKSPLLAPAKTKDGHICGLGCNVPRVNVQVLGTAETSLYSLQKPIRGGNSLIATQKGGTDNVPPISLNFLLFSNAVVLLVVGGPLFTRKFGHHLTKFV
jgi:hypothetical protein